MTVELGLRERKKLRTRQLIMEAASRLFADRGFDAVTVAEVARAAEVSEVTVFNYFPAKEDLVFAGLQFFEEKLIDAVRRRGPAESAVTAFGRPLVEGLGRLATDEAAATITQGATLIGGSPALQIREREVVARYTQTLARLLAEEAGRDAGDVEAQAVSSALMGVHRALVTHVRARALAGWHGRRLVADARSQAIRALARLERGLAGYAVNDHLTVPDSSVSTTATSAWVAEHG
jgi:AcrR family transcriptional regulator